MKNQVCLIPARYNSSRFPGKLLAVVQGKSVLQYTIESALGAFSRNQIFVATDDERIAKHVEALDIQVLWTSSSCLTGTDRIAEAVLKSPALADVDILVNLQGDHPCTQPATLRAALEILQSDPTAAMSTVATPIRSLEDFFNPEIVKVVADENANALYFSRSPIPYTRPYTRNELPEKALHHIGLYCFRRPFLLQYTQMAPTALQLLEDLEQLKGLENGWKIKLAVVQEIAIGVDVPADLERLESHLSRHGRIRHVN